VVPEVISSAGQDAVGDIGAPVVALPVVDVVRLGPGGRTRALGIHAAAVAHREHRLLLVGERNAIGVALDAALWKTLWRSYLRAAVQSRRSMP
jgi:hypothetical protein